MVLTIANPNPFPVTITAVQLPASTTDASGYTTSVLTTTEPGCLQTTPSTVPWNFAAPTSGSSHTLSIPLTVGAAGSTDNPLGVSLTDVASMGVSAPLACAGSCFSRLPSLTGLTATGGSPTPTPTPVPMAGRANSAKSSEIGGSWGPSSRMGFVAASARIDLPRVLGIAASLRRYLWL